MWITEKTILRQSNSWTSRYSMAFVAVIPFSADIVSASVTLIFSFLVLFVLGLHVKKRKHTTGSLWVTLGCSSFLFLMHFLCITKYVRKLNLWNYCFYMLITAYRPHGECAIKYFIVLYNLVWQNCGFSKKSFTKHEYDKNKQSRLICIFFWSTFLKSDCVTPRCLISAITVIYC